MIATMQRVAWIGLADIRVCQKEKLSNQVLRFVLASQANQALSAARSVWQTYCQR